MNGAGISELSSGGPSPGRVNLTAPIQSAGGGPKPSAPFPGFEHLKSAEQNFQADMLRGNWERTPLTDAFFSPKNVEIIQSSIRRSVYEKSQPKGYVIDKQSIDELKIIMRAIFYQYARNQPFNIAGQVEELNDRVIQWSVPHILSAVDHYMYYLKDIDTLPVPMAHPTNLSRAGSRSKPLNPFM
jgi:hypothetical protein